MWLQLLLIGLGITLEPFPITGFILLLTAERGIIKGLAYILGWLACLIVVIAGVFLATGNQPPKPQSAPSNALLAIKIAIGAVLILIALRQYRRLGRPRKPPAWMARLDHISLWAAAGLAAFLQPWTLVAAGAATVASAKVSTAGSYLALIGFVLLATSSFLAMELYATFAPEAAAARLKQLRTWMDTHTDQMIVAICLLLGFYLAGKSIYLLVS